MHRSKQHIKLHKVKVIQVPQYEGLFVKDILKFAKTKVDIDEYLPEFGYNKEPNRQWVWNLVNSLVSDDFQNYIDKKVKLRKQNLIKQQNIKMTINYELINIFKSSNVISSEKEKSHFLARLPKKFSYEHSMKTFLKKIESLKRRLENNTIHSIS